MNNLQDEFEEPLSESRKLRNKKYEYSKEISEYNNSLNSKNQQNSIIENLKIILNNFVFLYRFKRIVSQVVKDMKTLDEGVFNISPFESSKIITRKRKNIEWIKSEKENIKKHYPNEFIKNLVRGLGLNDSSDWYN
jgi:hypothetical protein